MPNWDVSTEVVRAIPAAPVRAVERGSNGPDFGTDTGALAEFLGWSGANDSAVAVNEQTALGSSAVWRAVSIIAGLAQLPLYAYNDTGLPLSGPPPRVASILDDPGAEWFTPYEWRETLYLHLALHGNAYLLRLYNNAGQLAALFPIHPTMVTVRWWLGYRNYTVTIPMESPLGQAGLQFQYTEQEILHIRGLSGDGLQGYSPLWKLRNPIGTGLSGDKAAARSFKTGALIGGIVSAPGITREQGKEIKTNLRSQISGVDNAGDIAVVNAALQFSPWSMNAEQAQFIESRQFQVEEVARAWGIPKVLLAEDGASTWGSGIAQLDTGMAKYTFGPYTSRVNDKFSHDILSPNRKRAYTDYTAFLEGTPQDQATLGLTLAQTAALIAQQQPTDAAVNVADSTGGNA